MNRWAHYGHCKEVYVKVGQKVKKGQKVALLGGTGTDPGHPDVNKSPHLHFEIWKQDPKIRGYNSYSTGLSKAKLLEIYEDPTPYVTSTIPTLYDHLGYGFLSRVNGNTLHPGIDINGPGQDLGNPEYAVFDGVVQWVGTHINGWGNHFYIKRQEPIKDEDYMALKDTLTETSLAKAKAGYFVWELSESDGKDLKDYLKVIYNGKPLGEQNYKALLDYLEKHSRRQKVLKFLEDKGLLDDIKNL